MHYNEVILKTERMQFLPHSVELAKEQHYY